MYFSRHMDWYTRQRGEALTESTLPNELMPSACCGTNGRADARYKREPAAGEKGRKKDFFHKEPGCNGLDEPFTIR